MPILISAILAAKRKIFYISKMPQDLIQFQMLGVCDEETYKELERRIGEHVELNGYKSSWGDHYTWFTVLDVTPLIIESEAKE